MKNILNDDIYYVYVYLDPRKPGNYVYDDIFFDYEPFYVGKGKNNKCYEGLKDNTKTFKKNKIKKILNSGYFPVIIKYIENISEKVSFSNEKELIIKIGRLDKKLGPLTNLTDGGEGYTLSDETKRKIGLANTDKIRSQEHKDILQNLYTGKKCHTQEWIDKLSIPVIQYDLNMNFIKEHESIKIAASEINIEPIQISKVCSGKKYYKTAGGFKWGYKDKNIQGHITTHNVMSNHSEATKQKMRKPKIWKTIDGKHPNNNKIFESKYSAILQYDLNMNLIREWDNINALCKECNYHIGYMINVLHNTKNYAYKYYWKFKN